tara:strand:- start:213 stop:497 length:285 start_codon:yes stop_codon:yes gene_type:complete
MFPETAVLVALPSKAMYEFAGITFSVVISVNSSRLGSSEVVIVNASVNAVPEPTAVIAPVDVFTGQYFKVIAQSSSPVIHPMDAASTTVSRSQK